MLHVVDLMFFSFFLFVFLLVLFRFFVYFFCFLRSLFFLQHFFWIVSLVFFSRLTPPFSRCVGLVSERLPASSGTTKLRFCKALREALGCTPFFPVPTRAPSCSLRKPLCCFCRLLDASPPHTSKHHVRTVVVGQKQHIFRQAVCCVPQARLYS